MAKSTVVKADEPEVVEQPQPEVHPHPSLPVDQTKDMPNFEGDAKQGYVDINDPAQGNLTYVQLQQLKK